MPILAFVLPIACGEPAPQGDGDTATTTADTADTASDVCVDPDEPAFYVGPCAVNEKPEEPNPAQLEAGAGNNKCESHADCTDGLNGRCVWREEFYYGCIYDECMVTEDCEAGQLCACSGRHQCVPFDCVTDDDCEGAATCRWHRPSCDAIGGRFCHTPDDTCCSNADCPDQEETQASGSCLWDAGVEHWSCGFMSCYD